MKPHILRHLIHALRVEYHRFCNDLLYSAAGAILKVIDVLLWRLPEVIDCNGLNLKCTVTGAVYSSAPRKSKKSVQELLEDVFQVSEFSYRRVKSALQEAYASEELV